MNTVHINRFAALAIFLAAAPWHAAAQTTSLVVTPSEVSLTQGEPTAEVTVTTDPALPAATQFNVLGLPDWLALDLVNTSGYSTGGTFRFRLIPENLDTTSAEVTFSAAGLNSASVTVSVEGLNGGPTGITPSPASLSFTPADPGPELITLLSNDLDTPTYSLSLTYTGDSFGWLTVNPALDTFTNSPDISVEANPAGLDAGTHTAILRLTRADTSAVLNIPITLTIGGGTGRVLTPSTTEIILSGATPNVSVTIVPSTGEPVPYTLSWSSELEALLDEGYLFPVAPPEIAAEGSELTFSIFDAALVPPTSGTLSLIPHPDTGYEMLTIPFAVNTTGELPLGPIRGTPTSLSFNAIAGGDLPDARTISVTSTDASGPQAFNAIITAGSTWLTVTPNNGFTPQTLTVTVNPAAVGSSGTYNGNIVLRTITGIVAQNIPVTMTVTGAFTVNVNPNRLTLTGAAGGPVRQGTVQVTLASGSGDPQIQASASTTSGGSWLTVSSNSTTLPATLTIGANPANLAVGNYSGNIAVTSGGTTVANIPVTLRVLQAANLQVSPTTLTFTHQTTGTSGPPAQNVQITSSTEGLNWAATATSSGNWLQVSPANGTVPATLTVSVNPSGLQPGSYTGTISVSSAAATNSPRTISVTLTVVTPAAPQITSFVNSASLTPAVAVPGMIFTIFGTDLGPATGVTGTVTDGMLGTTLENVRVLFDGTPAPLLYVSANQINGVVPFEVFGRLNTRMRVEYQGAQSSELELRVENSSPGIYTEGANGSGQAAALNQDGTVNNAQNAEARGRVIVLFATGTGQTNPAGVTGRVITGTGSLQTTPVRVTIGGIEAQVEYAGPAPGLIAGGTQINAVIPQDAPTGSVPVTLHVGNASSQSNVNISVQ